MLAAVADEQHVGVAELRLTVGAAAGPLVKRRGFRHLACLPVRALDRPGNYVLQAAEHGAALAHGFVGAEAVGWLDLGPAPSTCLIGSISHGGAHDSRARGRSDRAGAARAGPPGALPRRDRDG